MGATQMAHSAEQLLLQLPALVSHRAASSNITTPTPVLSSGPPRPNPSSLRSNDLLIYFRDSTLGENFEPTNRSLADVLHGRQGRFYLRVYDDAIKLVDSGEFRYCADLREIRVNDHPYSRDMLLAPSSDGHASTTLQFVGTNGATVRPALKTNNPHAIVESDGTVKVAPYPKGDKVVCTLASKTGRTGSVDVVVKLPRVWWRLEQDEGSSDGWSDTPLVVTRDEFRARAKAGDMMQLRLPLRIRKVSSGFGDDLDRTFRVADGLPLEVFVDYEEIDNPLKEDASLRVKCDENTVLTIIRVTADPPPPPTEPPSPPHPLGKELYARVKHVEREPYARLKRARVVWQRGKGFSCGELRSAGLTVNDAVRLHIPIDKRRRSAHRTNIDTLNKVKDHAGS